MNWTNDYEEMGGDMQWGAGGEVSMLAQEYGFEGEIKPLFAMQPYTGEAISLFEVGNGQYFLFNAIESSLFQIKSPSDLETIVSIVDDESQGLGALDIEAL